MSIPKYNFQNMSIEKYLLGDHLIDSHPTNLELSTRSKEAKEVMVLVKNVLRTPIELLPSSPKIEPSFVCLLEQASKVYFDFDPHPHHA